VTALLPGWVHTEFHDRAEIRKSSIPSWLWLDASDLVAACLKDVARGRAVSIPSLRYRFLSWWLRHLPPRTVRWVSRTISSSRHSEQP
jgi:short-subunit dehydrogenase